MAQDNDQNKDQPVTQEELDKKVVEAFNEAIETPEFEGSLFLKVIKKRLIELRDYFIRGVGLAAEEDTITPLEEKKETAQQHAGMVEIYISLYAAEGTNLKRWETIISTLSAHSISRPVYKNESDLSDFIKTKDYQQNDAYVAIKIHESEILKPFNNKTPVDKLGRELLVIKEGAIRPENVTRFMHLGSEYVYKDAKLVKVK